jgi:thioredoxin 1
MSEDPELERLLREKQASLIRREGVAQPKVVDLDRSSFASFISGDRPALVDFWAEWCYPCRIMLPILQRLAQRMGNRVAFGRLNVDENPDIASRFDVYSIPTFILFRKGREVGRLIGARPEREFEAELERLLA